MKQNDDTTTIDELKRMVQSFTDERNWSQFHHNKDLAIGMVTEASELLDIFRFKNEREIEVLFENEERTRQISNELADVLHFVILFANKNQIDLSAALHAKLQETAVKYPIDRCYGSNLKYTERD